MSCSCPALVKPTEAAAIEVICRSTASPASAGAMSLISWIMDIDDADIGRFVRAQALRVRLLPNAKSNSNVSTVLQLVLAFACCHSGARSTLVEANGESSIRLVDP
jgi:hypothetical protein